MISEGSCQPDCGFRKRMRCWVSRARVHSMFLPGLQNPWYANAIKNKACFLAWPCIAGQNITGDVHSYTGEAKVKELFLVTEGKQKVPVAGCHCDKGVLLKKHSFKLIRNGEQLLDGQYGGLSKFERWNQPEPRGWFHLLHIEYRRSQNTMVSAGPLQIDQVLQIILTCQLSDEECVDPHTFVICMYMMKCGIYLHPNLSNRMWKLGSDSVGSLMHVFLWTRRWADLYATLQEWSGDYSGQQWMWPAFWRRECHSTIRGHCSVLHKDRNTTSARLGSGVLMQVIIGETLHMLNIEQGHAVPL